MKVLSSATTNNPTSTINKVANKTTNKSNNTQSFDRNITKSNKCEDHEGEEIVVRRSVPTPAPVPVPIPVEVKAPAPAPAPKPKNGRMNWAEEDISSDED